MAKINCLTEKGKRVQQMLDNAKFKLGLANDTDHSLIESVEYLIQAVDHLVMTDGPCWELCDADEVDTNELSSDPCPLLRRRSP